MLLLTTCGLDPAAQPDRAAWHPVKQSISRYIDTVSATSRFDDTTQPPSLDLKAIGAVGLPVVDAEEFQSCIADHEESRRILAGVVRAAGWEWLGYAHS